MTVDAATLAEIQDAVRGHDSLVVRAGGTKSPAQAAGTTIGLSKLRGITEYSPAECVLTAWAGTPLRDIEQALRAHAQYLPFDPPLVDAGATIGGTVATGLSGSGRYRYGGVRDFLIGARVVDGEGTIIRSGGKVVKNAAGFLLHHALVGSAGRFGVIAEVTFKVFPLPEARATLKVTCGSAAAAASTARSIEATRFDCEALDFDTHGTLWVRIAGRSAAVRSRLMRLHDVVGGARIEDDNPEWAEAREFTWAQGRSIVKSVDGPHTATPARYICAGAASWIACDDCLGGPTRPALANSDGRGGPEGVARDSQGRQAHSVAVTGVIVRGPRAGAHVGTVRHNEFESRVRRVLDPRNKFSATPDSRS